MAESQTTRSPIWRPVATIKPPPPTIDAADWGGKATSPVIGYLALAILVVLVSPLLAIDLWTIIHG